MKRNWLIALTAAMVFLAFPAAAGERNITFHTGAVGGLYMEPGIIWSEAINTNNPDIKLSCILGGGVSNSIAVAKGQPNENLGIIDPVIAMSAIKGEDDFASRLPGGTKALTAILRFNVQSWLNILAQPEAVPEGVTTFGELLEKKPDVRILLKIRGSTDEMLASRLFATYGYTYESLQARGTSITFNNPADISTMMIDGHGDVTLNITRIPAAFILDMESSVPDLRWLAVEEKSAKSLSDNYGYLYGNHPRGVYASLKQDMLSLAMDHIIIAHADMDEELVYQMTKAMLKPETIERLKSAVPAMATFDAQVAGTGTMLPLHKGALRAYKELGLPYDE